MARARLHLIFQEIHGRVGDKIFRSSPSGETIVYQALEKLTGNPKSAPPPHLAPAHAYARAAMEEPEMRSYH